MSARSSRSATRRWPSASGAGSWRSTLKARAAARDRSRGVPVCGEARHMARPSGPGQGVRRGRVQQSPCGAGVAESRRSAMHDDDEPKPKPRRLTELRLEPLAVAELEDYIGELRAE